MANEASAPMTAEGITCPECSVTIGGADTQLRFDNRAYQQAEKYWRVSFLQRMSFQFILAEFSASTFSGLCAVVYGASASADMRAGKLPMTPAQFDSFVKYRELQEALPVISEAIRRSLPESKNA